MEILENPTSKAAKKKGSEKVTAAAGMALAQNSRVRFSMTQIFELPKSNEERVKQRTRMHEIQGPSFGRLGGPRWWAG